MTKKYPWETKWTTRAKTAINFMSSNPSIIDLGGGQGEIYGLLAGDCNYTSIDLERWNEHTIVADLNKEFPVIEPAQFVLCLGTIEYIVDAEHFLKNIKSYSNRLIISYRKHSNGGMDRNNFFDFAQFKQKLYEAGWEIICSKKITKIEKVFFCKHD